MAQPEEQWPSLAEQERNSANYIALREERDRSLDLTTRQRLRIQRLSAMLRVFVDAADASPPSLPAAADIAQARALLDERQ